MKKLYKQWKLNDILLNNKQIKENTIGKLENTLRSIIIKKLTKEYKTYILKTIKYNRKRLRQFCFDDNIL